MGESKVGKQSNRYTVLYIVVFPLEKPTRKKWNENNSSVKGKKEEKYFFFGLVWLGAGKVAGGRVLLK